MDASVEDQLLEADRRFNHEVAAARGADRAEVWASWFAGNGRQLVPGAVVGGREAITGMMGPVFAVEDHGLTWDPDLAEGSGDWGWTSGRYVSRSAGADGPETREGRYLTVWTRTATGWKVAVDTGIPDPQ